ncbi:MAG: DUF134 domain-containing protein [Candidatus Heimdallarchaeaceae archaeon]
MPRPRRVGRIFFNPSATYFKPVGISMTQLQDAILTKEELEAVRLIDYENQSQTKVAKEMKISQPTLSRLLTSARKKIADALVNGKAIKIEGGVYKMVTRRGGAGRGMGQGMGAGRGRMGGTAAGPNGNCICPKCGTTASHQIGIPCTQQKCPKCGQAMTRA